VPGMNAPPRRLTLNIIFEDTNFQKNQVIQSLYNSLTGNEGRLNLATQQINLKPDLFNQLITTLLGIEQMLDNQPQDTASEVKFIRICLESAQPFLHMLRSDPDEPVELGVRFHHLTSYTSPNNPSNLDVDEFSLDVWIMDSDGLSLNPESLNDANHMSVMNIRPFFEISKPNGHWDWDKDWYKRRQSPNAGNSLHSTGVDHIVFFLNPNLEPIIYDTSDASKEIIQEEFRKETIQVYDRRAGGYSETPSHEVILGISYLSRSPAPIRQQKIQFKQGEEIREEIATLLFSQPWNPTRVNDVFSKSLNVEDFVNICTHTIEPDDQRLRTDFVSGSVYLKKYKSSQNGRPIFLARPRSIPLDANEIVNSITTMKWTVVGSNEAGGYASNWSDRETCNAPILIDGEVIFCENPSGILLRCGLCGS